MPTVLSCMWVIHAGPTMWRNASSVFEVSPLVPRCIFWNVVGLVTDHRPCCRVLLSMTMLLNFISSSDTILHLILSWWRGFAVKKWPKTIYVYSSKENQRCSHFTFCKLPAAYTSSDSYMFNLFFSLLTFYRLWLLLGNVLKLENAHKLC